MKLRFWMTVIFTHILVAGITWSIAMRFGVIAVQDLGALCIATIMDESKSWEKVVNDLKCPVEGEPPVIRHATVKPGSVEKYSHPELSCAFQLAGCTEISRRP